MKLTKITILPLALGFFALANVSCEKQTPAENVAEEVEEANAEVEEAAEEVEEAIEDAVE